MIYFSHLLLKSKHIKFQINRRPLMYDSKLTNSVFLFFWSVKVRQYILVKVKESENRGTLGGFDET